MHLIILFLIPFFAYAFVKLSKAKSSSIKKTVKIKNEKILQLGQIKSLEVTVDKFAIQSSEDFIELLLPLSLKLAFFDKSFHINENKVIEEYFVDTLGFDKDSTKQKIGLTITKLSDFKLIDAARNFSSYVKKSAPKISVSQQILDESYSFLNSIVEADENIDETEVLALQEIKRIFDAK